MRIWHKDLLPYLDDFHIVSQYRELLAIKRAIDKNGTPNHRLVNKVLDYSIEHFKAYALLVKIELIRRKIKFIEKNIEEIFDWESDCFPKQEFEIDNQIYKGWHDFRYLEQCFYNLQEKFDCGIVSENAYKEIFDYYNKYKKRYMNQFFERISKEN